MHLCVLMDSNHNQQQQQQTMNSGLTRYRSAPSSYFSNLINTNMYEDEDIHPFFTSMGSVPQAEHIASNLHQYMDSMKQEDVTFSSRSKQQHQQHQQQHQQQQQQQQQEQQQHMMYRNHEQAQKVVVDNNDSVGMNLLRQSSSPAGFLQQNNMDNGYSMMRSMDSIRRVNGSVPDSSSDKRLKSRMARIPENEGKIMSHSNGGYVASFNGGSWDESVMLNDEFKKEYGEYDRIDSSKGRIHASTGLTHQLSLPTSSNELSVMENLMQFQDGVPLRSRAKRGCATHPRSIAERVRRTRISERMRRLQDLVPNMDKQTNTADMLDLAVDYIKELQKQAVTLSEHHANCTCPHKQKRI